MVLGLSEILRMAFRCIEILGEALDLSEYNKKPWVPGKNLENISVQLRCRRRPWAQVNDYSEILGRP